MNKRNQARYGKIGGKAGRGDSKRRNRAHYIKIAKASVKARRLKAYQAKISGLG